MSWANNKTDAHETYLARKFYDRNILRKKSIITINSWDEHNFYGRVNQSGESILVKETQLGQVRSDEDTVMALEFVATAFQEFQTYFSRGINRGLLTRKSQIPKIRPRRGWNNPRKLYAEHLSKLFGNFNNIFLDDPEHGNKIENFVDYVDRFMLYFSKMGREFPVTLSSFIPSPLCNPFVSGLVIEIDRRPYDGDEGKVDFVSDPNFEFYKNAAARFGFLIDKNIPWRLTANLSSDRITKYIRKDITVAPLNAFFLKTHLMDMSVVFEHLIDYYNRFVARSPYKYKLTSKVCTAGPVRSLRNAGYVSKKDITHVRRPLSRREYITSYGLTYSLKNYFKFRLIEAGMPIDDAVTVSHVRRIMGLWRVDSVDPMNEITRPLNYIQEYISSEAQSLEPLPVETKVELTIPSNVEITEDYHINEVDDDEDIGDFPLPRGAGSGTATSG